MPDDRQVCALRGELLPLKLDKFYSSFTVQLKYHIPGTDSDDNSLLTSTLFSSSDNYLNNLHSSSIALLITIITELPVRLFKVCLSIYRGSPVGRRPRCLVHLYLSRI